MAKPMNDGLKKYELFLKWFLLFIIFEAVILISIINSELFIFNVLLNYLFVLALVPIIIEKVKKGRIDIFSPFVIFEFFYLLLFGVPALDLIVFKPETIIQDKHFYSLALTYIVVGLHFFQIGYFSRFGRLLIKKKVISLHDWSIKKIKRLAIIFSLISILSFFIVFKMSGGMAAYFMNIKQAMVNITTGSSFLFMAIILVKIPLLLWFCYNLKNNRFTFSFYIFLLFVIFLLMSLGERGPFMFLFVSMLVCYHYAKRQVNFFLIVTIGLCLLMFLTVYIQYRELTGKNINFQNINNRHISFFNIKTYTNFIINFDQLERVKDMTKYVPERLDFQYGKTFFNLIFKPIPSRIWAEKPQGAGTVATKALYPNVFAAKVVFAPSIIGELYMNFHVIGIILGMIIFGAILKMLHTILITKSENNNFIILYAILAPEILGQIRGDFSVVSSWLIFHLVFLYLALKFVAIKKSFRITN